MYQPTKMRDGTALALVRELHPELIVVAAYGRILPEDILNTPPYGSINVHSSLLPKYRGAAPINWAIPVSYTHLAQLRTMLEAQRPTGKDMDFLMQEFNRECNTIGSKCNDLAVTQDVVAMKAEVEKIREQVQNIE